MLPRSSASSVRDKIRRHRLREDAFDDKNVRELEKSANFARKVRKKTEAPSLSDLLLCPDIEQDFGNIVSPPRQQASSIQNAQEHSSFSSPVTDRTNARKEVDTSASRRTGLSSIARRDWTIQPLSQDDLSSIRTIETLKLRVHAAHGGTRSITLSSDCIARLRGNETNSAQNSWLDDQTIDGFGYLINERSRRFMGSPMPHRPSKNTSLFDRRRVRAYVFPTHFFTCWNGSTNGGYERVAKWRRKIPAYNTIGMFLIPACINDSHWVLAVVDADGRQVLYYDKIRGDEKKFRPLVS